MALHAGLSRTQQLQRSYVEISRFVRVRALGSASCQRISSSCLQDAERCQSIKTHFFTSRASQQQKRHLSTKAAPPSVIATFETRSLHDIPSASEWTTLETRSIAGIANKDTIQLIGYVTSHRTGRKVDFLTVADPTLSLAVQVVCTEAVLQRAEVLTGKIIESHTPVLVKGALSKVHKRPAGSSEHHNAFSVLDQYVGEFRRIVHVEVQAEQVFVLNNFPNQLVAMHETNLPPELRHLSFRTDHNLRNALRLRAKIKNECAQFLSEPVSGFMETETPLLFKSTPEGAREFVVPTRKKGFAYALPQSPQQYKQILMASGFYRYFQFARCFRDEDMRADRQPEFTQLDIEMAFANSRTVMSTVEALILGVVWPGACRLEQLESVVRDKIPSRLELDEFLKMRELILPVWSYQDVMSKYGSDKPDPRLGAQIERVDSWIPERLKNMLTDLENPIIELFTVKARDQDPAKTRNLVAAFMDLPTSHMYVKNPDGMAGISVYDSSQPLCGLAAFGHESAAEVEERFAPQDGDIFIAMCRPDRPFSGGSTTLGNFRRDLLSFAVAQDFIDPPTHDSMFWVIGFPLFSPTEAEAPGQDGQAGICSTHHPFTAPSRGQDLSQMLTDPLSITGDHYDLVINGVEVGGGSRRIHDSKMQEFIFEEVLRMKPERVADFRHLLKALDAGCPPHAGFAIGFDRLMTILLNRPSVRDVIAFPKFGDGEDKLVGSPSELTAEQLGTYHLRVSEQGSRNVEQKISQKA